LLSEDSGCICITDSTFKAEIFNTQTHNLTDDFVTTIYEDENRNSWILTKKGSLLLSPDHDSTNILFSSEIRYPIQKYSTLFCDALEFEDEIWFGSDATVKYGNTIKDKSVPSQY
jgi:hypothetical protein